MIPIDLDIFPAMMEKWAFQFKFSSFITPKNFVFFCSQSIYYLFLVEDYQTVIIFVLA